MSKAFDSIKQGLSEAIAHARGENLGVQVYRPHAVDVKALRQRVQMTQEQFAARFGFSVATLIHWERGDRRPQGDRPLTSILTAQSSSERDLGSVCRLCAEVIRDRPRR